MLYSNVDYQINGPPGPNPTGSKFITHTLILILRIALSGTLYQNAPLQKPHSQPNVSSNKIVLHIVS